MPKRLWRVRAQSWEFRNGHFSSDYWSLGLWGEISFMGFRFLTMYNKKGLGWSSVLFNPTAFYCVHNKMKQLQWKLTFPKVTELEMKETILPHLYNAVVFTSSHHISTKIWKHKLSTIPFYFNEETLFFFFQSYMLWKFQWEWLPIDRCI